MVLLIFQALLDGNKFPDRTLQISLHRIETEQRQQQALNDNDQRLFKHKGLIYNFEPTMVVERPASPLHYQSALREYEETGSRPHYMTSRCKVLSRNYSKNCHNYDMQ